MTRLEVLKAEKEQIKGLRCLSFGLIDKCIEWYDKEIEAIVIHGADNKFYGQQADEEHDGCKDCVYQDNPQDAMPCRECKQNYMDKWKAIPKEEPKVGKWLGVNKNTWCNNCAIAISQYIKGDFTIDVENLPNYCPNCGAKMGEPQERSE